MVSTLSATDVSVGYDNASPVMTREDGRTVVWLAGEHDLATVSQVANALATAISTDDADLVVDLSAVTFMSAATVEELVRGRAFLREHSRTLTVRAPSRFAKRVLDLCDLSSLVESHPA
jgi:anti-anti-sigma factor